MRSSRLFRRTLPPSILALLGGIIGCAGSVAILAFLVTSHAARYGVSVALTRPDWPYIGRWGAPLLGFVVGVSCLTGTAGWLLGRFWLARGHRATDIAGAYATFPTWHFLLAGVIGLILVLANSGVVSDACFARPVVWTGNTTDTGMSFDMFHVTEYFLGVRDVNFVVDRTAFLGDGRNCVTVTYGPSSHIAFSVRNSYACGPLTTAPLPF